MWRDMQTCIHTKSFSVSPSLLCFRYDLYQRLTYEKIRQYFIFNFRIQFFTYHYAYTYFRLQGKYAKNRRRRE